MLVIEHVNGKQNIDIGTNRNAHNVTLRGQPPKEELQYNTKYFTTLTW
jgi:hypothetical protein